MGRKKLYYLYNAVISIVCLLVSMFAFSYYDISGFFAFIPKDNVPANLSFYLAICSFIRSFIEMYVKEQMVELDVLISPNRTDNSKAIQRTLTLVNERMKTVYLIINVSGEISRLTSRKIVVTFPKGITVSRQDNAGLASQKENEIEIDLVDVIDIPGKTVIRINVLSGVEDIGYSKQVTCKLDPKCLDFIFVAFASNTMGIESEN